MIKVLHTIDTTGPGGAETMFVNLAKGLDAQSFESFAAIRGPGWVCSALRKNGIEPFFVQSAGRLNFQYLLEMVRIIRRHKIDIVQSHLLGSNLYSSLAGMICHVPVISTFHGFVDSNDEDKLLPAKRAIINAGSHKIVFVSNRLRVHFIQAHGFSTKKSITIYNGVDTSIFKPQRDESIRKKLGLTPDNILIGALGNIRPAKGYECFLKAAELIHRQHPECRFAIAGEGSGHLYENLLKLRSQLKLDNVFFFLGFQEDTAKMLNNLDIFVLTSISEGFSISTLEAMACGLPVVVTRSGGPEEIIIDGQNGLLADCNEESIAATVNTLIYSEESKQKISLFSTKKSLQLFSLTSAIESYMDTYSMGCSKQIN